MLPFCYASLYVVTIITSFVLGVSFCLGLGSCWGKRLSEKLGLQEAFASDEEIDIGPKEDRMEQGFVMVEMEK